MKVFEVLFKRTKTGAIQSWTIHTEVSLNGAVIIKQAGQLTGKKTRHEELISVGKNISKVNETTPEQQADSQAESDWKGKKDEGYKSLQDLGIDGSKYPAAVLEDRFKDDKVYKDYLDRLIKELGTRLPQFNSDANGNVKPMLAKAVDWSKVTYPCYVQPKLDGVRCLMVVNEPEVKFLSRNGKDYITLNHIGTEVFEAFANGKIQGNFILDGEIYSDELTFQQIIAAVKKQRSDSLKLKFRAYDIVNDEKQSKRIIDTEELVHNIGSEHIKMVGTEGIEEHQGKDRIMELHDTWVQQGYEGAMIRLEDGIYGQGQRSSALLKVKQFDEAEFEFLRWEKGQRDEDLIAVCQTENGLEFKAKMIGTRAYKKELYDTPVPKNSMLTVKYFGMTDEGNIRFPIGKSLRDFE